MLLRCSATATDDFPMFASVTIFYFMSLRAKRIFIFAIIFRLRTASKNY
jgi:hypothetical protein